MVIFIHFYGDDDNLIITNLLIKNNLLKKMPSTPTFVYNNDDLII